jgi:transposase
MHCDQPSLFAGLLAGFTAFGGLTRTSIFDNASTAVTRVLRGRNRAENEAFPHRGGLALHVAFAAPAKATRRAVLRAFTATSRTTSFDHPPSYADPDELNVALVVFCNASVPRAYNPS